MKLVGGWIACGLLLAAAPAVAQGAAAARGPARAVAELNPEILAIARQIVDMAAPPETRRAMLLDSIDTMMAQVRAAALQGVEPDAGAEAIMTRHMARVREMTGRLIDSETPAIFAAIARAYARNFTLSELQEIRAFVSTPTGAKYFRTAGQLLADPDVAQANTAYMTSALRELTTVQTELRQDLTEYFRRQGGRRGNARAPTGS
jgi:hypothetical protein